MSKLFFRRIFSRATLEYLNELSGQEEVHTTTESRDREAARRGSTNEAPQRVSLIPPNVVRQLPVGEALLIHGGLPPAHIQSLRWFTDPSLRALTEWSTSDVDRGLPHVSPIGNTPTDPAIDVAPETSRSGDTRNGDGIAGEPRPACRGTSANTATLYPCEECADAYQSTTHRGRAEPVGPHIVNEAEDLVSR